MTSKSKYIENNKVYWGPEFAEILGIKHNKNHDEIVAMACYTMLYHIADSFKDGEFFKEILDLLEVSEK